MTGSVGQNTYRASKLERDFTEATTLWYNEVQYYPSNRAGSFTTTEGVTKQANVSGKRSLREYLSWSLKF